MRDPLERSGSLLFAKTLFNPLKLKIFNFYVHRLLRSFSLKNILSKNNRRTSQGVVDEMMKEMASLSEEMELEVRPGGMLVQRRDSDDRNHTHGGDYLDVVDVALGPAQREIHFPVQPTSFGELKRMVEQDTGSKIARQKLFGRKKKDEAAVDDSNLQAASTEDMKEAEEPSKLDVKQTEEILKAMQAIDEVRFEVDKLAERVYALEVAVKGGTKVAEQEFIVAAELLMRQLLKLDMIEAGGEARIQRRAEVLRIQKFHDSLDDLKATNAKPADADFAVPVVKTNWEKFDSGMGSLTPPPPVLDFNYNQSELGKL